MFNISLSICNLFSHLPDMYSKYPVIFQINYEINAIQHLDSSAKILLLLLLLLLIYWL